MYSSRTKSARVDSTTKHTPGFGSVLKLIETSEVNKYSTLVDRQHECWLVFLYQPKRPILNDGISVVCTLRHCCPV